jgi:hypothetical protein
MTSDEPKVETAVSANLASHASPAARRTWLIAIAVFAVWGVLEASLWAYEKFGPKPIVLVATDPPQNKGWQIQSNPFWVKATANGKLPQEGRFQNQFVVVVFRDNKPYYQRMIDPKQIEAGRPFDFALPPQGITYSAAFVTVKYGQPDRRLSNTIWFTH